VPKAILADEEEPLGDLDEGGGGGDPARLSKPVTTMTFALLMSLYLRNDPLLPPALCLGGRWRKLDVAEPWWLPVVAGEPLEPGAPVEDLRRW